jgi:hypothetical protein
VAAFKPTICIKSRYTQYLECVRAAVLPTLLASAMLCTPGCAATKFYQREKLNDRSMQFDQDAGLNYVRQKIEAAREGSLGGFGSAEAGGCGCQ